MTRHVRNPAVTTVAVTVVALLAGCGGSPAVPPESAGASTAFAPAGPKAARPASLEQLAASVGCTAEVTGKALDYRQGVCKTSKGQYVLLSFDTDKGMREWLGYAQMYGGVYLVGNRWVLSANPRSAMEDARHKLGGTIEETGGFGASPSSVAQGPSAPARS